jgi:hypothetical protein
LAVRGRQIKKNRQTKKGGDKFYLFIIRYRSRIGGTKKLGANEEYFT